MRAKSSRADHCLQFAMLTKKVINRKGTAGTPLRCTAAASFKKQVPGAVLARTVRCHREGSAGAPLRPTGAFCQSKCPACAPALQGACTSASPCSCPSPGAALSTPLASCRHMAVAARQRLDYISE